jgi:hypothetical protein
VVAQRKAEFFIFEHGVDELNDSAPILLRKMQASPKLADVASVNRAPVGH